jgi:predicted NUDIX family NTP pyrophosphohydrolase
LPSDPGARPRPTARTRTGAVGGERTGAGAPSAPAGNGGTHPPGQSGKPLRRSAGIVLYRVVDGHPQVLLGHMGGPFWRRRDAGAWTIPKGGYDDDEDALVAARREYEEEIGHPVPDGDLLPLGDVLQANGKIVTAWAVRGDLDPSSARSNTFEVEWPPNSGRRQAFPELDRVAWFSIEEAQAKAVAAQAGLFQRLAAALGY